MIRLYTRDISNHYF